MSVNSLFRRLHSILRLYSERRSFFVLSGFTYIPLNSSLLLRLVAFLTAVCLASTSVNSTNTDGGRLGVVDEVVDADEPDAFLTNRAMRLILSALTPTSLRIFVTCVLSF